MKEYLTIAEAAEAANVTKQAIYKRLDSTLQPFVQVIEGKRYIHKSALKLISTPTVKVELTSKKNNVEVTPTSDVLAAMNRTIHLLESHVKTLEVQLNTKDKQIDDLNNRLEQALTSTSNGQYLLLQANKDLLQAAKEEKNFVDSEAREEPDHKPEDIQPGAEPEPKQEKRKGFFGRFFG